MTFGDFGSTFSEYLNGSWEQSRQFVVEHLEQLQTSLTSAWNSVFDQNNNLLPDAISGDSSKVPVYVSNEGPKGKPQWDKVNVRTGVKDRLQFANFIAAGSPGSLVGRESVTAGNFEEISTGSELLMVGKKLTSPGAKVAVYTACGGL